MNSLSPLMTSARTGDGSKDEWLTPIWLFDLLDEEFNFQLDAAAHASNTLCDTWYSDGRDGAGNGLTNPWTKSTFCNPPYSQMKLWVEKAFKETLNGNCDTAVLLVAARTDTKAWWNIIRHQEVRFLPGRLKFDHFDGAKHSAPFPSAVVVFRQERFREPKTIYWDIRETK